MCRAEQGDVVQMETTDRLVVLGELTFALQNMDFDGRLIVRSGRKDFRLAGRDRGVALDEAGEYATEGFDTERKRSDIEQEHVLHVALQHTTLNGGTDGNDFIGIHALVRLLADERTGGLDNAGHSGHATDEHEFVDLIGGKFRILQAGLDRSNGALEELVAELFHLRTGERDLDVLGTGGIGRDEWQVDVVLL